MLTILAIASVASLVISVVGVGVKAATANELIGVLNDALDINNMSGLKTFDKPYMNITSNALIMITNFMNYAQLLVCICAFLCLIFNAFKLWASTVELKKFYVDTIYKCVIVIVLMNIYPLLITKTYTFATELGVEASGGEKVVVTSFAGLADQTKKIWEDGTALLVKELQNGLSKEGDEIVIDEKLIQAFTDYGMTEDEAVKWAKDHGFEIASKENKKKVNKKQKSAIKNLKNDKEKQKFMKQSMAVMRAMSEILTGADESALADGSISANEVLNMGSESLNNVFYNPYIEGTKRLSFSAMMKTAVIIAECATAGALASTMQSDSSKQASWEDLSKSKNPHLLCSFIGKIFMNTFVYKIIMLIAIGYCMIEYIVTLVEFLIVAAVSSLLIPFFFIDATKQYTMNILKSIFSYFVKILVTTMMIFFVVSMYIDLGSLIIARKDLDSIMSLLVYACISILGMVLVKNTGKIAGAVISGNPSMGLGEIAGQVRGMTHAAQAIGTGVKNEINNVGHKAMEAGNSIQRRKEYLEKQPASRIGQGPSSSGSSTNYSSNNNQTTMQSPGGQYMPAGRAGGSQAPNSNTNVNHNSSISEAQRGDQANNNRSDRGKQNNNSDMIAAFKTEGDKSAQDKLSTQKSSYVKPTEGSVSSLLPEYED